MMASSNLAVDAAAAAVDVAIVVACKTMTHVMMTSLLLVVVMIVSYLITNSFNDSISVGSCCSTD